MVVNLKNQNIFENDEIEATKQRMKYNCVIFSYTSATGKTIEAEGTLFDIYVHTPPLRPSVRILSILMEEQGFSETRNEPIEVSNVIYKTIRKKYNN